MLSRVRIRPARSEPVLGTSHEVGQYNHHYVERKSLHSTTDHSSHHGKHDSGPSISWNIPIRYLRIMVKSILLLWGITTVWVIMSYLKSNDRTRDSWSHIKSHSISSVFKESSEHNLLSSTITSGLRGPNAIPLPLPPQKVSVVLMNYSRPRMIRESSLMRTLLAHPNVGEVILLHANPKTRFEFVHDKVFNVDATQENDEIGLSLRFYFCQMVNYDWVIQVDDDMEFNVDVISELLIEFNKDPKRIVGRFGRQLKKGNSFNGYSSRNTHKQTDVILTKLMIMERDMCSSFFEYAHLIWEDIVLNQGEGPLWNGEDIFMSLVANHVYGHKNNYAMDWLDVRNAPTSLEGYTNAKLDISGDYSGFQVWSWEWWQSRLRRTRHYSYRGMLWQAAEYRLAALERSSDSEPMDGLLPPEELDKLKI